MQVNPTRMELTRLKKKLTTATRGHKLLKDKRDELMRLFLERVRENRKLRMEVEEGIRAANQNFMLARAGMQDAVLKHLPSLFDVLELEDNRDKIIEDQKTTIETLKYAVLKLSGKEAK